MRGAKDSRVRQVSCSLAGEWQRSKSSARGGDTYRDIRPLVRIGVSVVVEENGRQESGSYGGGGRGGYETYLDPRYWQDGIDEALRQALVNLASIPRSCRRNDRRARSWLAGHPAARSDRPRPRRRFQPQKDVRLCRPFGRTGCRAGRDGGGRRHHCGTAGLAHHRRRRYAYDAHRSDRRRHPQRLHAGSPERPVDGHEAHRQRAAPVLRAFGDAAHDQHLHAGRRQSAGRDHRQRRGKASTP